MDPQRTRYGFGYGCPWSLAGIVHALEEDIVLIAGLWGELGGVVVVTIVQLEWGSSSSSHTRLFWAEPNINNFYINKLLRLGNGGA